MVQVLTSFREYVDLYVSLPIEAGSAYCLSFIPSGFFPKHSISRYFADHEKVGADARVAQQLWNHRGRQLEALRLGRARMCIQWSAIEDICSRGRVHEATPRYEVGFAERIHIFKLMLPFIGGGYVVFVDEPVPYTFRLCPPAGALIDVTRNTAKQTVQGLWIEDGRAFSAFEHEFERLYRPAATDIAIQRSARRVTEAIECFVAGRSWRSKK